MTYLTNIDSFSKAPLDSYPQNLSMLKSNPMPSLSMDAHSLFQKPMKAWYTMKLNAFATSMSFASATKVNGLHLHSELPRKRSDLICLRLLPTQCHPFTNCSNALKGLLTVLPLISTWDSGQSFLTNLHNTCAQSTYLGESTVTSIFQWDLPVHQTYTKRKCQNYSSTWFSSSFIIMTYLYSPSIQLMTTYDNLKMFSNGSTATTFTSMPKYQASVHWRPNT